MSLEVPRPPRTIPLRHCLAYSWGWLLVGGILLLDGVVLAIVAAFLSEEEASARSIVGGVGISIAIVGLLLFLVGWIRIRRRRRIRAEGQVVPGRVVSVSRQVLVNPTPLQVRFRAEDPLMMQEVEGSRWFLASMRAVQGVEEGMDCLVAFDPSGNGRAELGQVSEWVAWQEPGSGHR